MTAKNHPIDLPQIPSLPPLQLPEPSDCASSSSLRPSSMASQPLSYSSPSSYASQDTFLSPRSSPPPDSNGISAEEIQLATTSRSLSRNSTLRKSISVDSFVGSKPPPQASRATRGNTMSSNLAYPHEVRLRLSQSGQAADPMPSTSRMPTKERERRGAPPPFIPLQSRGTSSGASTDARDHSYFLDESDMERSEDLSRRARKSKTASNQAIPPPGELGLPSRLQTMSSFPNISASHPPAPIIPARSSSLSHKMAKQKSPMSLDTHIPPPPQSPQISIAVIGAAGCGKSTVIRKGLKAYKLSESATSSFSADPTATDDDVQIPYTRWTGKISAGHNSPDYLLRILEVDISALDLSQSGAKYWERPSLNGIIVCYDAAREESFQHVADGLREFAHLKLPTIVLACKSDLPLHVDPKRAAKVLQQYDVGLIEVATTNPAGKDKIRTAFEWIFKAIFHELQTPENARSERDGYRNPASPSVLVSSPSWDDSRASSATPTAASIAPTQSQPTQPSTQFEPASQPQTSSQSGPPPPSQPIHLSSPASPSTPRTATTPTSPTRARSTSDLLSVHEQSRRQEREQHSNGRNGGSPTVRSKGSMNALPSSGAGESANAQDEPTTTSAEPSLKESRAPWMTLDELLNKLLFMAVSDDDPVFVSHFLLTYRRFASPRSILLAMQKRMRALDQPSGDPMFACYAQLRICLLLDKWISTYPNDFAVPGAAGALSALVKFVLTKTYLLHYGAGLLPFLDTVPSLKDRDQGWAIKIEEESDGSSSISDEEDYSAPEAEPLPADNAQFPVNTEGNGSAPTSVRPVTARNRKSSLPLTAKALVSGTSILSPSGHQDSADQSPKQQLKRLVQVSEEVQRIPHKEIAENITRIETAFFLQIEPRHWFQHVLVQGRKDPDSDPIAKFNYISNHIALWVVSLILCHDKPKARAKQIEKFVQVAEELRVKHNYSALRAIIAGIHSATFDGDEALNIFRAKSQEQWKHFQSYDHLLQAARAHQKYRMALRNTKGACIPALEIHLSDLIRAHEGNPDYFQDDSSKIHWAKFNMMARFIDVITQCQNGCRLALGEDYFPHERRIPPEYLLLDKPELLMDLDMQLSRIAPPDAEGLEDVFRPAIPRTLSRDIQHPSKDAAILRKIFFW